ncbi:branched-chain amino acid ABC transporter [Psychromonas marina]|uniref:Branched-chain amino acid ABC transporter n=1 Tax=Psychromonas marina TaxID=88364 RepID=A0ABQ6DXK3_9GAMM|nr:AzlD domain-containing protein [Psychromonas marina]GLS89724.1 branched-chain amino acid ABC transporter [Psychromonas marina]
MNEAVLIIGMTVITFTIRFVMFAFAGKMTFPNWLALALKFVPPAVLTAIIVPSVVMPQGYTDLSIDNSYLIAAIFAVTVAIYSKSLLKTIGLGMMLFLILRYLAM